MAMDFICEKGHSYIMGDLPDPDDWWLPEGAPACLVCRSEWLDEEHKAFGEMCREVLEGLEEEK